MTQARDMAQQQMVRLYDQANKTILEAVAKVTDDDHHRAHKALAELFNSAPWLATSEAEIGGCLHVRYCDLFVMISDYLENT